jgi:hypothetical protein
MRVQHPQRRRNVLVRLHVDVFLHDEVNELQHVGRLLEGRFRKTDTGSVAGALFGAAAIIPRRGPRAGVGRSIALQQVSEVIPIFAVPRKQFQNSLTGALGFTGVGRA